LATTQDIYDSFGRLKEEILPDPDGGGPLAAPTLHWGHDGDGNVTSYEDASGNFYYFIYNSRNEMVEEDDPSPDGGHTPGPVWHWVYDATGALTETIDPMNRVTQLVRDGDSNVIQTIAPNPATGGAGDASTTTYDTFDLDNEKLSETTPNGATTSWQRDDLGRTTTTTQPVPEPGEAAPVWQDFYNADSELTQEIDPLGRSQTTTLDGMGRAIGQTAFTGVQTAWTYNNLSEILTTTLGTGTLAETSTNTWDALGRKTAVQDANGTTQMAFDLAGRMTSLADSDSNQTVWVRDNLGRVTSEQNPSGTATFSYDTNSNLTKEVDRLGQERDFVFDDLNRETAEKWMSGSTVVNTIATAYNADGEVTSTGDNYSNYAFAYSGQGKVTSVDDAGTPGAPHVALASQYDTQGDRTSLAATLNGTADFINTYTLDALSRLREIDQQGQSGGNAVAEKSIYMKLNGIGDITEIDRSNMVNAGPQQTTPGWTLVSYDTTTGLLDGIDDITAGTSIDDLTYTHDTLARIATFSSIDGTATYGYDHTSQIVSAAYTTATGGHQPANVSFSWDPNGNNATTGSVVAPNNEVTNDGTFTYQFDADGNRTVRTRVSSDYASDYKTTYNWDYRNRLTDVEFFDNNNVLTKHVHYVYGVYDNLIGEDIDSTGSGSYDTTENFVLNVSPKLPVQVLSISGTIDASAPADTLLKFVNGNLVDRLLNALGLSGVDVVAADEAVESLAASGAVNWMLTNNQGTPTDTVNSNGTLIDHRVFSPFGQKVYDSEPMVDLFQGFAGGIADANTGFVKDGERWYDPKAAVWISVDPAGFGASHANLTRHVRNNVVNQVDPSGLAVDGVGGGPGGGPSVGWTTTYGEWTLGGWFGDNNGWGQPSGQVDGSFSVIGNTGTQSLLLRGGNVCNTIDPRSNPLGTDTPGIITTYLLNYPPGTYQVTIAWSASLRTTSPCSMMLNPVIGRPDGGGGWTPEKPLVPPFAGGPPTTGPGGTPATGSGTITVTVTVGQWDTTTPILFLSPGALANSTACAGRTLYTASVSVITVRPVGAKSTPGGRGPSESGH
jgi:RHS repeat-associated protein